MTVGTLLHLVVLFVFLIAALGQPVPSPRIIPECINAVTSFSQDTACFGSQDVANNFRTTFNTTGSLFPQLQSGSDPSIRQATATFYNAFCSRQDCVQSYADTFQVCYETFQQQVYLLC